jgi:hypothetical protein
MPEPLGNSFTLHVFVNANHAGNVVTRRSHTGILLFVQNSPIQWLSKRQNTVETSTFGSEFVALRSERDMIISMRYKSLSMAQPKSIVITKEWSRTQVYRSRSYRRNTTRLITMLCARRQLLAYWRFTKRIRKQI